HKTSPQQCFRAGTSGISLQAPKEEASQMRGEGNVAHDRRQGDTLHEICPPNTRDVGQPTSFPVWGSLGRFPKRGNAQPEARFRKPTTDRPHSALMFAARFTLAHFSVSSAMSVLKSADEPPRIIPPRSTNCVFSLGSARPTLISLLSLSTIPAGVLAGA